MKKEKYLITSALPYANGPVHIGQIAGAYLPADIYVRFLRLCGHDVVYICGTDEHGVPITLNAEKEGITPKELVERYHNNIKESFKKLRIEFDNFSGTSRSVHHEISQRFFLNLHEHGFLETQSNKQFYDAKAKKFLPDRYVVGTCPYCKHEKARGDECPKCGKWIESTNLINPISSLTGTPPELRETSHWYLCLDKMQPLLEKYIENRPFWKDNVKNFAYAWFKEGLGKRPITRDISWGVQVPLEGWEEKVLYVWFDAPIGYLSSTVEWAEKIGKPDKWREYWQNPDCKMLHFIGKDNIPFHIIVWPAILMGQYNNLEGTPLDDKEFYVLPYNVPANEHLTIEGNKLSTSTGNAVWVDEYCDLFPTDPLRYYLAANAPETNDSDFSWKAFQLANNSELANILGNFINRTLAFINKNYDNKVPALKQLEEVDEQQLKDIKAFPDKIKKHFQQFEVRRASFEIIHFCRYGNKYFDIKTPWVDVKSNPDRASTTLHICAKMIKMLAPLMYPVMPDSAEAVWEMIGETKPLNEVSFDDISQMEIKAGTQPVNVRPLFKRIEDKTLDGVIEDFYNRIKEKTMDETKDFVDFEAKPTITFDDFTKIDLRVATIKEAVKVEKSKKLMQLQVNLGKETRQIVAGIAEKYNAENLIGKQIIVVANLKEAKLMGIESKGMLLAATDDENNLIILSPEKPIKNGSKVS